MLRRALQKASNSMTIQAETPIAERVESDVLAVILIALLGIVIKTQKAYTTTVLFQNKNSTLNGAIILEIYQTATSMNIILAKTYQIIWKKFLV